MTEINEYQILQLDIGRQKLKDMSAFSFLQWMALKINGVKAFSSNAVELTQLTQVPPMSKNMPDDRKIDIIKKMIAIGIQIP